MHNDSGIKSWINRVRQFPAWAIIVCCIILSEIITLPLTILLNIILWGFISIDDLLIGAIDAFIVSFIVGGLLVYFLKEIKETKLLNQKLQLEIATRVQSEKTRREIEIKAMEQSKLAYLGQIATGIAHEINQPLSYIKCMVETTLEDYKDKKLDLDELNKDCRYSLKQINRITKIIDHLRTFGRDDALVFENISLEKILDNTMILMAQRLKLRNVELIQDINENLPIVWGSALKLEQVFINLFQNSLDALEGIKNGIITVSIYPESDNVKIRVTDNGRGIPEKIINKVFEPFFTTKDVGKGTGLGLSIVYGIIQEHNGAIEYLPEKQGSTILISLSAK